MRESAFFVAESPIHGFGLFTKFPIAPHQKVIDFKGQIQKAEECMNLRYCFSLGEGMCINTNNPFLSNHSRFINDAYDSKKQNNLVWKSNNESVWLESNQFIGGGSELLVSYGQGYWD